jgi:hypothetical protein
VQYTIDAGKVARPTTQRVCIAVGGLLRVDWLGPGEMSIKPPGKVSCAYEAAVHVCRLIGTGTVTVQINAAKWTHSFTLVVAESAKPPRPATACVGNGTYTIDASSGGPPWWALCLRKGVVLRLTGHGPGNFTVTPSANVSCWYEAGVRECTFLRTGTVTFTVVKPNETRPLIVVVVP